MSEACRGSIVPQRLPEIGITDSDIVNRRKLSISLESRRMEATQEQGTASRRVVGIRLGILFFTGSEFAGIHHCQLQHHVLSIL